MPIEHNDLAALKRLADDASRAALQAMGAAAVSVAKPNCPVKTGNLRRSHRYVVEGDHVDIGVTADYGAHVHNGTARNKDGGQPWLRDSVSKNINSITDLGQKQYERKLGL